MKTRWLFAVLVLTFCVPFHAAAHQDSSACALTPLTPAKPGENMFTPPQEGYLGDVFADSIGFSLQPIDDKDLSSELNQIGQRLVNHLPPTGLNFRFYLSDAPEANALSFVGGRVYVTRQLVSTVRSEDELAGVIGHELGHIVTHQQAKTYTRVFHDKLGISEISTRQDVVAAFNRMLDENAEHGKIQIDPEANQQEADRIGLEAVVRAGYSPQAFPDFWDRYTENKGKKGSWFSEFLGTTNPNTKRYREMIKELKVLPPACKDVQPAGASEAFQKWQLAVTRFQGLRSHDALQNLVWQKKLEPPLQDAIHTLRFSPDGKYVLAQDGGNIYVLNHNPFQVLFRIYAPDAYAAHFTPDSAEIVFYNSELRVERWNIATHQTASVQNLYVFEGCLQTMLSPDGKTLACYRTGGDLDLIDVPTSDHFLQKKNFLAGKLDVEQGIDKIRVEYTLQDLNLGFSPDGKYFVAGLRREHNLLYDLAGRREVPVPGGLKEFIGTAFAFIAPDRILGYAGSQGEQSAIVEFPSGKQVRRLELGGGRPYGVTRGDYALLRPIRDNPVGILDINTNQIVGANKFSAIDIYDKQYVSEMKNGHLGLFNVTPGPPAEVALPRGDFGTLKSASVSDDLSWLAVSGRMRGAVWSLPTNTKTLNLREFKGSYFATNGTLFADFPKHEKAERSIGRITLPQRQFSEASKPANKHVVQRGPYLVHLRPANKPEDAGKKADDDKDDSVDAPVESLNLKVKDEFTSDDTGRNTVFEVSQVDSGALLWSLSFPKETPNIYSNWKSNTVTFAWYAGMDAAKAELRNHPEWKSKGPSSSESDILFEVHEMSSGKLLNGLVVNTGKGSFQANHAWSAGDWLGFKDSYGRATVYSLSNGELHGKQFGTIVSISPSEALICLENVPGQLEIYSMKNMTKVQEFSFAQYLRMAEFVNSGKDLFVLTADQTAYLLTPSTTTQTSADNQRGH